MYFFYFLVINALRMILKCFIYKITSGRQADVQ